MNDCVKLRRDLDDIIGTIENESIRVFTREMIRLSDLNMKLPASTDHHLPDERKKFGNTLHSVRVASLCVLIADAVSIYEDYDNSVDVLKSASTLHDACRHGLFGLSRKSRPDHPYLVREFAKEFDLTCDNFDDIMEVIEAHMGRWGEKPVAFDISAALALHLADCIVARWAEVMPSGSKEGSAVGK